MTVTNRRHFPYRCKLDGRTGYLLWYSDHADGVVTDEKARILVFPSSAAARRHALAAALQLEDEPVAALDIDEIVSWTLHPNPWRIACAPFLDFWNLMTDVAASIGDTELLERLAGSSEAYDKLFRGNNLPAVTPPGAELVPVWSAQEATAIAELFRFAGSRLREAVQAVT